MYLVEMLRDDPPRARGISAEHAVGADGRCPVCRNGGDGSGRSHGCRLGDAARAAMR